MIQWTIWQPYANLSAGSDVALRYWTHYLAGKQASTINSGRRETRCNMTSATGSLYFDLASKDRTSHLFDGSALNNTKIMKLTNGSDIDDKIVEPFNRANDLPEEIDPQDQLLYAID